MSRPIVAVVDYGLGNLFNIARALTYLDAVPVITNDGGEIRSSNKIILPGVGAFATGMENLRGNGTDDVLREARDEGKEILGICLGMQLLMSCSTEDGMHQGLDFVPGRVERLDVGSAASRCKVPQIGWNTLTPTGGDDSSWEHTILRGLNGGTFMYFVHSYCVHTDDNDDALALTTYGGDVFSAVIQKDNVIGCQFHPERSAASGIRFLSNFLDG